ncbi:site-specific integrase [Marinospirillum perlucidum]|uniref:site-specific integrase n=1 Tax=Marinospirillum perlucidum TaxID=1982602 RepID=UPI000DF3098D|nr:site-specific integrase [Marinospirillum perlucidum]
MVKAENTGISDSASKTRKGFNKGYDFSLNDKIWTLSKDIKINLEPVLMLLDDETCEGFIQALAFYAENFSAVSASIACRQCLSMMRATGAQQIDSDTLINYRASLTKKNEWHLGTIRTFLKKWHELGYPGINDDVITLLKGWRIKGCIKGDAVKRMDPIEGPLSDAELQSFNEGVVMAYEQDLITLSDLAICLITSSTGRRPIQISHMRVADLICGSNTKGEPYYILNVPRGKQGDGFRNSFKAFAMTEELWVVVNTHVQSVIKKAEESLGFALTEKEKLQLPMFPNEDALQELSFIDEYRELVKTDKLHIVSRGITKVIQEAVSAADIFSERTGEPLAINARRFRYTTGTRAAREGFGELVIAELLDHSDTQNAGVYIKNIPEHVKRLDEAVGFQLAPYAQAFAGVLVDSEKDAKRGEDATSRVRTEEGCGIGTCGEHGFCGANVPIPCYTCMHFQPWLDGPHEEVYKHLLGERERLIEITGDLQVAATLDRSITAVADVIQRCESRRVELMQEQGALQ